MIYSMTAFAHNELTTEYGQLICEIKSVNHRYLDIAIYVPDFLRAMESQIREKIRDVLSRGKIECVFRFQASGNRNQKVISINTALVEELSQVSAALASHFPNAGPINLTDIMRFSGVLMINDIDINLLQPSLMQLLDISLKEMVQNRHREGKELKRFIMQRVTKMNDELAAVKKRVPMVLLEQKERIHKRLSEAKIQLDQQRLEQEMVLFANRIDIGEEVDRAEIHLNEVCRVLEQGGAIGRRLDFLLQELNREANTLGSKVTDAVVTHVAVEMKVLIEQIREQIQNIE